MARRYSRSEKGKWQAPPELPTKRPPVRIPANDNNDLIEANRLTIIGRLTNPHMQKPIRAVIDFMAQIHGIPLHYWSEGTIKTIGKELGKFTIKDDEKKLRSG
ncbi:hypothetical protein Rs2_11642 [Raphanus sativus]|nr:hypothetical protein Rs2_11642 [Raphanus sativus]